jgi:hypothetical protein
VADDESDDEQKNSGSDEGEDGEDTRAEGEAPEQVDTELADGEDDEPDFGKKEDEPVSDVQMQYLKPLAEDQGEEIPDDMSEKEAADKIDEMQENASG